MPPFRLNIQTRCNSDDETIKRNIRTNTLMNYPKVTWDVAVFPTCAVVGGGPSLKSELETLRKWKGDIYAINDTAAYLSDNGIESYLFMIDAGSDPMKDEGDKIRGAVLATRCSPMRFKYKFVRTYNMLEDKFAGGVEGGPTAATRAPHLLLRMGYMGIAFFGCDSCFFNETHTGSEHKEALDNRVVVRAGGVDYITNVVLLAQAEYLAEKIKRHPLFLRNYSRGLLQAIIDYPDTWEVTGVSKDIIDQHGSSEGIDLHKPYSTERVWRLNS